MKNGQFEKMGLKELRGLRDRVDEAISVREKEERTQLRAKMAELATKSGFSVEELFGTKRAVISIKYRNPQNPGETWTGRGRRPRWIAKAGGDVERFRI
jgi:DNA-binding protein H-NS